MLHKTKGIVLHTLKYSETSVIAKVYTEMFGVQSYIIKGARSKNARIKAGLLQPMSLFEMEVYHKEKSNLQTIKELIPVMTQGNLYTDIRKTSIVLFIAELLYKSLHEEESNPLLFNFIFNSVKILDLSTDITGIFHLYFLVNLSKYLGFYPQGRFSAETPFFDLEEGRFVKSSPYQLNYLEPDLANVLYKLLEINTETLEHLNFPPEQKALLLEKLLIFYRLHLSGLSEFKSHKVLAEVLRG